MANFHIDPSDNSDEDDEQVQARVCNTIESEGLPGVAVTLCLLPDVNVKINIHFMFLVMMYQRM
jgi:hypothetical protein